jgi:hypothetical protein
VAEVYAADGTPVALGPRLAAGGEGTVFALPDRPTQCAKIYHDQGAARRARRQVKLQAMLARPPADPTAAAGHRSLAWPQALLRAGPGGDAPLAGFLMPRAPADARTALEYLQPEDRVRRHPGWGFRHLLTAARNLAAALEAVHHVGACVGDLNESNVMVSAATARVTLIDCDSFQVPLPGGAVARCAVGRPEYTAPEFVGRPLGEVDRTPAADAFALAVLIFQLLLQGYHPFSGRWRGAGEPPDVARRIQAGMYAYGRAGSLVPAPGAPPLSVLPPRVRRAFSRAFTLGIARPEARPSPHQWVQILDQALAELIACRRDPERHQYPRGARGCPWCALAARGTDWFPAVVGAQISVPQIPAPPTLAAAAPGRQRLLRSVAGPAATAPPAAGSPRLTLEPPQLTLTNLAADAPPRVATLRVRNIGRGPFLGEVALDPATAAVQVQPAAFHLSPYHGENEVRLRVAVDPRRLGAPPGRVLVRSLRLVDASGVRASCTLSLVGGEPGAAAAAVRWSQRVGAWAAAVLAAELTERAVHHAGGAVRRTLGWLQGEVLAAGGPWHGVAGWLWLAAIVGCLAASGIWRLRGSRLSWATLSSAGGWRPAAAAGAVGLALWPFAMWLALRASLHLPSPVALQWPLGMAFVPAAALAARGIGLLAARPLRRWVARGGTGPLPSLAAAVSIGVLGTAAAAALASLGPTLPLRALGPLAAVPPPWHLLRGGGPFR